MNRVSIGLLALCVVFVTVCSETKFLHRSSDEPVTTRIINGEDAEEGQFPYQVSLRNERMGSQHFCGGSILNDEYILTAAHCVQGLNSIPSLVVAVVGSHRLSRGGQTIRLKAIISHKQYNSQRFINDIALLRTASKIHFTDLIQPIALPAENIAANTKILVSGWGKTSFKGKWDTTPLPEILQFAYQNTISRKECKKRFRGIGNIPSQIHESTLCTENKRGVGICFGDSGGPLVDVSDADNKTLAGVVSWTKGCAKDYPDGYTRVHSYIEWINDIINKDDIKYLQ